jgi:replicative DNA helicase
VLCGNAMAMARWPAGHERDTAPGYCFACWDAEQRSPSTTALRQTHAALDTLSLPAAAFVRWPYAAVDDLTGPLAPGNVWYVPGASGGGKTTFITGAIDAWITAGTRVAVLPLELQAQDWRTHLAAVRAGVDPGDVRSGALRMREEGGDADAARLLDLVRAKLRAMPMDPTDRWSLYVSPERAVTAKRLERVFREASEHGYQVVVIDHIDHVGGEEGHGGSGSLEESKQVNQALLELAQKYGLVAVAMSQLNASRLKGAKDRLAKYAVPQTSDMYMHTFKEHVATGVLGLFRPIRPDADPDLVAKARHGDVEPQQVLEPGCMGLVGMKLRNYGSREGQRRYLALDYGRPRDRTADEARDWEGRMQGLASTNTPNGLLVRGSRRGT